MFTLPINRDSTVKLLVPGKTVTPRVWTLATTVQAGIAINFGEWIPGDQTTHQPLTIFNIEILLDEVVVATHAVTATTQTFINEFTDTDQTTNHILTFRITGKQVDLILDDIHDLIKLNFSIEGLDFKSNIFDLCEYVTFDENEVKHGSEILGENGALTLPITTPIYTWLLSHQELICPNR